MTTSTPTNEQLLRQVIEAQVKGGFDRYDGVFTADRNARIDLIGRYVHADSGFTVGGSSSSAYILEIILDTDGLKAAYGYDLVENDLTAMAKSGRMRTVINYDERWTAAAQQILAMWNCGYGNNLRSALETAVSYLPEPLQEQPGPSNG